MPIDLTTEYLGLKLRNPLVVGACPLTAQIGKLLLLEQAGTAAVVFPSLFEEQIEQENRSLHPEVSVADERLGPALSYFPGIDDFVTTPDAYLRLIDEARKSISIPVIGSLNGVTPGGWTRFASLIESAGADALELNMYALEANPQATAQEVEARYLELVSSVREAISIPFAVKLGPYFTAFGNLATRLVAAGANGLVLFNRFFQPDVDIDQFKVAPSLRLSDPTELRLPLRWIALLSGQVGASLAATSGIHSAEDVIKALLVGADVAMVTSAIIQHGPQILTTMLENIERWMSRHNYQSAEQFRGLLNQGNCQDCSAFERANYMKALLQNIEPFRLPGNSE